MNKIFKHVTALCLIAVLTLALTACGSSGSPEERARTLVQGNMDELYLDNASDAYLELVDSTREASHEDYLAGLESEVEFFAYYFDINNLTEEMKSDLIDLYQQIYAKAKYTVGEASKLDNNTYAVKLTISPLNIFELVWDDSDRLTAFFDKYENVDVDAMTDEEFAAYDKEWAETIIALCWEKLPEMGYMDDQTMALQITKDSDDYWGIDEDDFYDMDEMIIYYR